jgi:hypothetical protein
MPAITVPKDAIATDPGYLYYSAPTVTLPTNTVAGSVFTDSWPVGWFALGATRDGSDFTYNITTDQIVAAEYFDPLKIITTGREAGIKFDLYQVHATNMKRALNGGTITVTGSGATTLNAFVPSAPGAEVRCQIGWESQDGTERLIAEQCFQVGSLTLSRKKGSSNASLPVEFRFEVPSSGFVFRYYTAGVVRG